VYRQARFSVVIMGNMTCILPVLHCLKRGIAFVSSCCFVLPGSVTGDQYATHTSCAQFGQMQTSATSCELTQQPLDMQTSERDEDSTASVLSATCTRTRTVKTPKHYDV